jgi:predicted transcriptional regulator
MHPYSLEINKENVQECLKGRDLISVYKILLKDGNSYKSYHNLNHLWDFEKYGVFLVNRDITPTIDELQTGVFNEGYYVYTHIADAIACCGINEVVVEFEVKKEDVVAVRMNETLLYSDFEQVYEEYKFPGLVCRRIEFVRIFNFN